MVNFFFHQYMANDDFSEPLDALIPKMPFSFFCQFWGLGHLRQWSPFWGGGGGLARGLYRPPPPPIESPPAPTGPLKSGCSHRTPQTKKNFGDPPPHLCVQNDQRDEGIILKDVWRGTWDPRPAAPHTPPEDPPLPTTGPKSSRGGGVGVRVWA